MGYEDQLLITYGLGYAFEKSKLLIISEIEEKAISQKELNLMEEINAINKFKENLNRKCTLNFPKNYISNIEEVLDEKLSRTIPIITSIRFKNKDTPHNLMDEYMKMDLSQIRLKKEGYIQKDGALIKKYLDNCVEELESNIKNHSEKLVRYNKVILKVILTTSFGSEFGKFLSSGQVSLIENMENSIEEQLKYDNRNNFLVKKKYTQLDFLNLLLFLEEWQNKHFNWDGKYTELMFSINKNGRRYNGRKSELKDYVISFIKERRYLYFPFGKYNEKNIFTSLDDEKYCNGKDTENNSYDRLNYVALKKEESNLYKITVNKFDEIDLDYGKELGYLLSYSNETVYISLVTYDQNKEQVSCVSGFEEFRTKLINLLEEHFITE